jgi:hypothetical protein
MPCLIKYFMHCIQRVSNQTVQSQAEISSKGKQLLSVANLEQKRTQIKEDTITKNLLLDS